MSKQNFKIVLAAGGTGGHLFPAFALTEELKRRGCQVFIVTDKRTESMSLHAPSDEMFEVPSATLQKRSPVGIAKTLYTMGRGVLAANRLLKRLKPDLVLGFGGYPTLPPLIAARLRFIPTILHDQNAVMGRANRLLARRVDAIATSFENVKFLPKSCQHKTFLTGNPVRDQVIAASLTPYPPLSAEGVIRLLVFGGSQGAQFFSQFLPPLLVELPTELKQRLHITQQCRPEDLEHVKALYKDAGLKADCASFFDDLPQRIAQSHLVICRSGASTVAELSIIGRPAIMVPLPHALDNDQLQNAKRLAAVGGGWVMEQPQITSQIMLAKLYELFSDPALLQVAAEKARQMGEPAAVNKLADLVTNIAVKR